MQRNSQVSESESKFLCFKLRLPCMCHMILKQVVYIRII